MSDGKRHDDFRARRVAVATAFREVLCAPRCEVPPRFRRVERWAVTAAGPSEGSAHALVWLLRRHAGRDACFVPSSYFAAETPLSPWDGLVVVSHELSPSACLALSDADRVDATVVITAALEHLALRRRGDALVLGYPLGDAPGDPLRACGSVASMATVTRFVEGLMALDGAMLHGALDAAGARLDALCDAVTEGVDGEIALVTEEATAPVAQGVRWRWLDALGRPDPPCWDVLQVERGLRGDGVGRSRTLVTLEGEASPLFERVIAETARACRGVRRLRTTLPTPAGFVELEAMFSAVLDASLAARKG